jgi:hypothetical protein
VSNSVGKRSEHQGLSQSRTSAHTRGPVSGHTRPSVFRAAPAGAKSEGARDFLQSEVLFTADEQSDFVFASLV